MKYEYNNYEYDGEDFYCYPNSNVLMNKFNIKEYGVLQQVERDISYAKIIYLGANPILGKFNLEYMQKIHKCIFENVYGWAGKIRGGQFLFKGDSEFCHSNMIGVYADDIFNKFKNEKYLVGLKRDDFIKRLAYFMAEINVLHPFREGNGRVQRILFQELSRRAGYELDFSGVESKSLLQADIEAYYKKFDLLIDLLNKDIVKIL